MNFIEIKATKQKLYLTEQELNSLLVTKPDLWAEALKRGKAFTRASQEKDRTSRKEFN